MFRIQLAVMPLSWGDVERVAVVAVDRKKPWGPKILGYEFSFKTKILLQKVALGYLLHFIQDES